MSQKKKFYVVWEGRVPGVYSSWDKCKEQIFGYENAKYKSFTSIEAAEKAYAENPWKHLNSKSEKDAIKSKGSAITSGKIIKKSLAVDAACSGNPGLMEYRGVFTASGEEIFHQGPFEDGTNNIGEFLAIVHALAFLKKNGNDLPIYSDSRNAIKWIEKKKCNTTLKKTDRNHYIFELIERAEKWLNLNTYKNPIIKWETSKWGEIPADFGRK